MSPLRKNGSKELFYQFLDMDVIKQPAMNITLSDSRHTSEIGKFFNDTRPDHDLTRRMENIRERVKRMIGELFNLHGKKQTIGHVFWMNFSLVGPGERKL